MEYRCHIYQIAGIRNMRDIGGYKSADGRAVAMGRFIRSTALYGIGEEGMSELRKIGVDCVVDLRSMRERQNAPDAVEDSKDICYEHVPMLDYISSNFASGDFSNFPKSMHELYIGLLENAANDFRRVFEVFADNRFHRYLFHCTAGKDRTGVTAMLLLGLANVHEDVIIEDYSYTQTLLGMTPMNVMPPEIPQYLFESLPETMRTTISHMNRKYGGAAEYLAHIGISEEMKGRIRDKMFALK